jgi:pyruvate/2-oxoglutarate dehydrogenase complex dihydrolipoamide dehydrogenase (E3) component
VCNSDGEKVEIDFDRIVVAVGRAARIEGFGLESIDVPISNRRTIDANEYLQAGHPSVYAVGDVVGPYQFTHAAAHQAWYAAVNALFSPFKKFKVDYSVLPWATYTDPEVARVGLNETDEVKVLTVPGKDKILGATIIGRHAGDLIAEFVLAMRHGLGLNKILGTVHAYPTWMEANKFAAGNWKKAHAPQWALNLLEKFHRWRRS